MTVVLDTSALASVVFGESGAEGILDVMRGAAGDLVLGAATAVEVGIVVEARQGAEALKAELDELNAKLEATNAAIVELDEEHSGEEGLLAESRNDKDKVTAALNA